MDLSQWLIVIPARLKSERLPRKPLADLAGKPLIVRVFENLSVLTSQGAHVIVAVDHNDTAQICAQHMVPSVMTSDLHQSGTDRCFEVAKKFPALPFILNVQGDEPFVSIEDLTRLMSDMRSSGKPMGTLGIRNQDWNKYQDPNVVKIVMGDDQSAIYFSRAPVPFDRDASRAGTKTANFWQHLGVYAFRRDALESFCKLPPALLETTEKLEQLRAVSAGWKILVSQAKHMSLGIDTQEDLESANGEFHARMKNNGKGQVNG